VGAGYLRLLQRLEQVRQHGVLLGLDRLQDALQALGSPQLRLPAVHVAGSNGKGSTAAMVESILRQAGLRTGLYTSPHLCRFSERVQIGGQEVDGEVLGRLDRQLEATGVRLTYFEVATALAFLAMAEAEVEVAVLEVGLGGRLDATNVCQPLATAITSIGLEHTDVLGTTLAAIAREKAGSPSPGCRCTSGCCRPKRKRPPARWRRRCGRRWASWGSTWDRRRSRRRWPGRTSSRTRPWRWRWPARRRRAWAASCPRRPSSAACARWSGRRRLEQVAPDVLVDGAHNLEGFQALLAALPPRRPRALLLSVVRGKPAAEMLALASSAFDRLVLTRFAQSPGAGSRRAGGACCRPARALPVSVQDDAVPALAAARAQVAPDGPGGRGGLAVPRG
jgi:dihydrofolate synthase/folylpolyglutamate synthase